MSRDVDAGLLVNGALLTVDDGPGLLRVEGHQGEGAGVVRGGPGRVFHAVPGPVEVERLGDGGVGFAGDEGRDVLLEFGFGAVELMLVAGEEIVIALQLGVEIGFGGVEEVALVEVLDEGFERERDEEADGDNDEVEGEVAPGVDGFVRGVDIHAASGSGIRV